MGLDFRHLQQIEAGTVNVTLATILRISDAFDVSPFVILPGPKSTNTKSKLGAGRPMLLPAIRALETARERRRSVHDGRGYLPNPTLDTPAAAEMKKRVARALKRERKKISGLTQEKLAKQLGCTAKYVQMVEGGKQNLTLESIMLFVGALNIHPSRLFEE